MVDGELARRTGLAPSAIRYYERIRLLPEPERASGRRRYQPSVLDQLAMIDIAQRADKVAVDLQHDALGPSTQLPRSLARAARAAQTCARSSAPIVCTTRDAVECDATRPNRSA